MYRVRRLSTCFSAVIFLLTISVRLWGFTVELSDPVFIAQGMEKNRNCIITNDASHMMALEIRIFKRQQDETNKDILSDAASDFLIYPNQLLLQPQEKKMVTLIWNGSHDPKKELAYRIIVEELPIDVESYTQQTRSPKNAQIRILRKLIDSLYVVGPNTTLNPSVIVDSLKSNNQQKQISITLVNQGNQHQIIKESEISLTLKDNATEPILLKPQALQGAYNLLAGSKFTINIPWPENLPPSFETLAVKFRSQTL